ncbi:putative glutamyl-tRNA amidotransferase, A subunit [Sesbania bispinosa]|nr:putative glutamyl-tRNA amidotransferase, A subunit [Sesbania bispinosa]
MHSLLVPTIFPNHQYNLPKKRKKNRNKSLPGTTQVNHRASAAFTANNNHHHLAYRRWNSTEPSPPCMHSVSSFQQFLFLDLIVTYNINEQVLTC